MISWTLLRRSPKLMISHPRSQNTWDRFQLLGTSPPPLTCSPLRILSTTKTSRERPTTSSQPWLSSGSPSFRQIPRSTSLLELPRVASSPPPSPMLTSSSSDAPLMSRMTMTSKRKKKKKTSKISKISRTSKKTWKSSRRRSSTKRTSKMTRKSRRMIL